MKVRDGPDKRENLLSLHHRLFRRFGLGILVSSPGSSLRYFCFFASFVIARMLLKHCRTTASE